MPVRVHHLRGRDAWLRCDHENTRLHAATDTIRLALRPEPDAAAADVEPWIAAWGTETSDGCGRIWDLAAGGAVARARDEDGAWALDVPLPFAARWLAVATDGLYVATAARIAFGRWDRPWVDIALPPELEIRGVAASGARVAALARDGEQTVLLRIEGLRITRSSRVEAANPSAIAIDPAGRMWVPTVLGAPPRRTQVAVFEWGESGASRSETYEIGRFDGRAIRFIDGVASGSTPTGWVRAYRVAVRVYARGRIETFALDSGRHGCVWHRVFADVCLPEGTRIELSAKTSDVLPAAFPAGDVRPRLPADADEARPPPSPLGSLAPQDTDGWVSVGKLHMQALLIDAPNPPRGELPALDPLPRGASMPAVATHTLEGLLKNGPGRYLWLRIELVGRTAASPVVAAVRVHTPRPSLLAFLPAWWRADPEAKGMDELLALYEAPLSRIEDRVDSLPSLFDPRAAPPEALDWLASFVGLAFEPQLPERVRRTLLCEAAALYRRRGTVGALERLCTILAEAPVRVVEAWRTRAASGAILGEESAVMGGTLELGAALDPTLAGNDDAIRAWFGQFAHRFQVIVHRPCTPWLQGILERAIERNKPAHTAHTLCFADGLTVGVAAVGISTVPRQADPPIQAVVDEATLGGATLSRGPAALPRPPIPPTPEES